MSTRARKQSSRDYVRLLVSIFEWMFASGLTRNDVRDATFRALKRTKHLQERNREDPSGFLATAALLLDAWHRNRRYLTASAAPRPIPLSGPSPSVEALIRAESRKLNAPSIARRLIAQRLLVPIGNRMYKPTSEIAILSRFDPLAAQHAARSSLMLLETIRGNLEIADPTEKLIERIAEIPDLPLEHVKSFRKFTRIQGWMLLRTVNDWLEARRAKSLG